MPLGCAQLAYDPQRFPTTVPSVSMLRRVRLRVVHNRFSTEISKTFRGRKILHSKSRLIRPEFMPLGGAQLAYDPQRSRTTVRSVRMLWRVGLRAVHNRKFFAGRAAKFKNFAFEIA